MKNRTTQAIFQMTTLTLTTVVGTSVAYAAPATMSPIDVQQENNPLSEDSFELSLQTEEFLDLSLPESAAPTTLPLNEATINFETDGVMMQPSQVALFSDLNSGFWARPFINGLLEEQIIKGFPNGLFRPNDPVTRAQFAAMLVQAFDRPTSRNNMMFGDVPSNHWAASAIEKAYRMGFLSPVQGTAFNPNATMTRLDIITALIRGLDYSSSTVSLDVLSAFTDIDSIPVAVRPIIAHAALRGMLVNDPNTQSLNLNQVASRSDVAVLLYQALVNTGDMTAISSPYVIQVQESTVNTNTNNTIDLDSDINLDTNTNIDTEIDETRTNNPRNNRQNCNQGIGNGSEGCDPGNSSPHGGSNDEGGRTPGGGNR